MKIKDTVELIVVLEGLAKLDAILNKWEAEGPNLDAQAGATKFAAQLSKAERRLLKLIDR